MVAMGFMLNEVDRARQFYHGFLLATKLQCEQRFEWVKFKITGRALLGAGKLVENGFEYHFKINYSPFWSSRFDMITVESNDLNKCADTHFNADGSLCLYHPRHDLKDRPFMPLVEIIPWLSEWVFYYDKYREYKLWVGPEYPHGIK